MPNIVKLTDSRNTWEEDLDTPTQLFRFPGNPTIYSRQSLYEALAKLCRPVRSADGITAINPATVPDVLAILEPKPQPKSLSTQVLFTLEAPTQKAPKALTAGNDIHTAYMKSVTEFLTSNKQATKAQLIEHLGCSDTTLTTVIKKMDTVDVAKVSGKNVYQLKG